MAGFDPGLLNPTLTAAPTQGAGSGPSLPSLGGVGGAVYPHHAVIGLVLLAVLVLFLLDRAGFRFAVTVGKG